ncbi:hypothetical protein [Rubneribacter sp.]|nr:hypothetical protein [Candidatus Rubneribacter avistercoris]
MLKKTQIAILAVCVAFVSALVVGCAPQENGDGVSGGSTAEGVAVQMEWSPDMDCSVCHAAEQESFANADCVASLHSGESCIDCHSDIEMLADVHEGKTVQDSMPSKLRKTDVDASLCTTCHDLKELATTTASSTILTDSNGKVVNPHDLPAVDEHQDISCGDCHKFHSELEKSTAEALAPEKCASCHHAEVYECHTCHS